MAGDVMHGAEFLDNSRLDPLFEATVQATEEAIVNSMVAARDMQGNAGTSARAIPHDALTGLMKRYGRAGGMPR
jgi:D-aminopeptidase